MTMYTFARWEFPAALFAEFAATVDLLKSDKYARRAVRACYGRTYSSWLASTRTDGRTRRIGTRACVSIGESGFMACVRQTRKELGYE